MFVFISDDMPPGQTPYTITLYAHNQLVDTVQPGDRYKDTSTFSFVRGLHSYFGRA